MAQTRKRRRRKRRGTQGGRVDPNRRSGRPRSREEAKARARAKRKSTPRSDSPPTWRSAAIRGLIGAVVITALLLVGFGNAVGPSVGFGALMALAYVPGFYYFDLMMWRRRERARIRAAQEDSAGRK
jgi:hypothetical protein